LDKLRKEKSILLRVRVHSYDSFTGFGTYVENRFYWVDDHFEALR
jgi:hypothetical protein